MDNFQSNSPIINPLRSLAKDPYTLVSEIALRIREFLNLEDISKAIVQEVRQFLEADRAIIYRFNPDMSGKNVAEAVIPPWKSCLDVQIEDTCFRENLGGEYRKGKIFVANDIYTANLTDCHIHLLERFQVRANLVVPILLNSTNALWGLLIVHQCSVPRIWQESDIQLIQQLSVQLAIAIQQAELYQNLQILNASLEQKVEERTRELKSSENRFRAIFDNMFQFIGLLSPDGTILAVNQIALMSAGVTAEDLVGRLLWDTYWWQISPESQQDLQQAIIRAAQGEFIRYDVDLLGAGGQILSIDFSLRPLRDELGQVVMLIPEGRDISEAKKSKQQLHQLNQELEGKVKKRTAQLQEREIELHQLSERLTLSLKSGAIGCWEWDIIENNRFWDARMYELFGVSGQSTLLDPNDIWLNAIHPDDLSANQTALKVAISGQTQYYDTEFRVIHPDHSIHFIKAFGVVVRDIVGNPLSMTGIKFDISDRKESEIALQESKKFIQTVIDTVPIPLLWKDRDSNYLGCNLQLARLHNLDSTEAIIGKNDFEFSNTRAEAIAYRQDDREVMESGEPKLRIEETLTLPNGEQIWLETHKAPLRDWANNVIGVVVMFQDITTRKCAEAKLKHINDELLLATKLKDEFLANMSHELRTPLNAILGLSNALGEQILGSLNEKQIRAISTVESSGEHLLSLINDILNLSKISSGMMELNIESVSVQNLCDSSLVFVKQQAFQKKVQITSNIPKNINNINIEERRIRQVLINLLTNAVKFTPSEGQVSLLVAVGCGDTWQGEATIPQRIKLMNSPMIIFQVVDTGIGIACNDLQRLFQPFVQVNSSLNRQYEGTGLGLALVKQIVELHGGQVMTESEVGKGSCFSVALPYEMAQSRASKSTTVSTTLSPVVVNPDNAPLILLAEDNEANIQTFTAYLTAINYRIVIARNGEEAIAMAKSDSPDIILMDIQMPNMDGLEAIRLIRADESIAAIPIIALTALAMEGDRERCLAAGANEYLAKPVKFRQLNTVIQQILASL